MSKSISCDACGYDGGKRNHSCILELKRQLEARDPQWIDVNTATPEWLGSYWVSGRGGVSMMVIKPDDALIAFNICGITHWAEIVNPEPPKGD